MIRGSSFDAIFLENATYKENTLNGGMLEKYIDNRLKEIE